eukprot:scaffold1176_cov182-Skeletonema_marinoi.AAC.13
MVGARARAGWRRGRPWQGEMLSSLLPCSQLAVMCVAPHIPRFIGFIGHLLRNHSPKFHQPVAAGMEELIKTTSDGQKSSH